MSTTPSTTHHDITATLFHRPRHPTATPASSAQLTTPTVSAFIETIQSIIDTTTPIPHTHRFLDSPSAPHVLAITFTTSTPLSTLRHHPHLSAFETTHSLELVLLPTSISRTPTRLAVFDMDSTLIQQEVIDVLAAHAGVEPQVASITARAMNGELDFAASLRSRVALLKGLKVEVFEEIKPQITLTPGAEVLLRVLKKKGVKTALLSGGFTPLARWVTGKLGIEYVHANFLQVDAEGKLTGELEEGSTIVDAEFKRRRLLEIAEEVGVKSMEEVLAVGDGANDLLMLGQAGLGVAVNAKERVQREAGARLNGKGALLDVLYLMGMTGTEIDELAG